MLTTSSPLSFRKARELVSFLGCVLLSAAVGCPEPAPQPTPSPLSRTDQPGGLTQPTAQEQHIALIGTSDLHGYVEGRPVTVKDQSGQERTIHRGGLALLGGYLDNVRAHMPVLLLDGGDLFQGTIVSNMEEGRVVVEAYNALGYQATAIGNHEFDYGPVGPRGVPGPSGTDDPTGALKARAAEAHFPFLAVNLLDKKSGKTVTWPNVHASVQVKIGDVPIGIVGAITEDTPHTTNPLNLRDVTIGQVVPAVREEAAALRAAGVAAVVLTIHEGANCQSFANPRDLSSCHNNDERILSIVKELDGVVDAVVAGHTHAGVAHFVGDVPIIQSFSYGTAFGRVDLTFRRRSSNEGWHLDRTASQIYPPTELCEVAIPALPPEPGQPGPARPPGPRCDARVLEGTALRPTEYEGKPVVPNATIEALLRPHLARAIARANTSLGVRLADRVRRNYRNESPLAQLMADLIRSGASRVRGQPVDIAVQNGGGIRNDLPAGPLTYGHVFEVQPFDNRLAIVRLSGAQLAEVFRRNFGSGHGVLVPSGLRVEAKCEGAQIQVTLRRDNGQALEPGRLYTVAMSDFLASGGDNFAGVAPDPSVRPEDADRVTFYDDVLLRELIVEELTHYRGPLLSGQPQPPRLIFPGTRPLHCPPQPQPPPPPQPQPQ